MVHAWPRQFQLIWEGNLCSNLLVSTYFFLLKFFVGENMNPDGMVGLLDFREDGVTPFMIFFKDGLEMEKCVSIH